MNLVRREAGAPWRYDTGVAGIGQARPKSGTFARIATPPPGPARIIRAFGAKPRGLRMGIHRINTLLIEEYSSPADRRIRIETDIRLPREGTAFAELRGLLHMGNAAGVRTLLHRVLDDLHQRRKGKGGRPDSDDLRRVRKVVDAAFGPGRRGRRKG